MEGMRVLLVDDHSLVRAGIRALLGSIAGVAGIEEASSGRQAVELAATMQPDLVLMDIAMDDMDGLAATRTIAAAHPHIKVVILSMHDTGDFFEQALRCGARGYLLKDAAVAELEMAIAAVMRGDVYLSPAVSRHLVGNMLARPPEDERAASVLTPRQTEILELIGSGLGTKEIARRLDLSVKTVEAHRAQIMERLGVRDIANLLLEAARRGLITLGKRSTTLDAPR
ncbi:MULTISPECIES: response regulator transcription factor [Thauera]|jgi:DNA-binding NarL/FixJ family response regulator|uniref:Response regulator transcription factor n=2 Tax=Thauera aminoaromatica TaxID=164330 RepID=C4ZM15_THASP|nr:MULTISPECIES: response regulator transcription factor [Thauera]MDA0234128.1 response regulator transcription factor [Pseudomonadota bacterium]TMW75781.1 response regulator transcription factor [Thauera sp. UPWRP]ACK54070.1 two component transcriptional regulator, LuxR family [Thauera aminoaromatica]KIN92130.1 bacterial regulatory s, luxR family protein [Thauera sp. SWB20]MCK6397803.1 response regulator transcription factor [Thauera aminoaromatica]